MLQQGQLVMRLELFPKSAKLLIIHPARAAWRFARCKLATLSEPAKVPFYGRVTDLEGLGRLTNTKAALQHSFDDPFP